MARYEHLPIYKKAMDLAVHFEKVVAGFSRYHKYTLGTELRNKSREIVSLIVKANSTRDRLSLRWWQGRIAIRPYCRLSFRAPIRNLIF